ncbi:hypothetical protein SEA_PATELGO_253 [Streptomyces phage Patelgo]|nr:hypothetical protein SEA_PATELGO_253 [Streptomyces phage Patelgo]
MYTITEVLPKRFMEESTQLEFVADVEDDFLPRIGDNLVYNGDELRVKDVERNLDTRVTFVYVTRKRPRWDDEI